MKYSLEESVNESKNKRFKNDLYSLKECIELNKARIYNFEHRKKPAELVRKDLISAMKLGDHETLNRNEYMLILDSWREDWEKGVQVPVNAESLPNAAFQSLSNLSSFQNNTFDLPKELILKSETLLDESISTYELDLQDISWLQAVKNLGVEITENFLEDVINELEQECARNIKAHQVGIEYDDHTVCAVCQSPDVEDGNEIVFCDICNICVHQACYGITEIPEGDWVCRPCKELGSKKNAVCVLCTNVGGALKPTTKPNQWAHISCVFWIPEARFVDDKLKEQIETKDIPNWRWNLLCSFCNVKKGAPIICDMKNCRSAYHVSCAFKHKLKTKVFYNNSRVELKSFCIKHSQMDLKLNNSSDMQECDYVVPVSSSEDKDQSSSNSQAEFWKYIDINNVHQEIFKKYSSEVSQNSEVCKNYIINKKHQLQIIDMIHQYWKLKRISNYGNSLIKLTFAQKFKEQMKFHISQIFQLRYHLEHLRTLIYMVSRREKIKRNWLSTQKEILQTAFNLPAVDATGVLPELNPDLFLRTIFHHSIYPMDDIVAAEATDSSNASQENRSLLKRTQSENSLSVIVSDSRASQSGSILNSDKSVKPKSERAITNSLIRELKRFASGNSQSTKLNPYAKIYFNPSTKRKSVGRKSEIVSQPIKADVNFSENEPLSVDDNKDIKVEQPQAKICETSLPPTPEPTTHNRGNQSTYKFRNSGKFIVTNQSENQVSNQNDDLYKLKSNKLNQKNALCENLKVNVKESTPKESSHPKTGRRLNHHSPKSNMLKMNGNIKLSFKSKYGKNGNNENGLYRKLRNRLNSSLSFHSHNVSENTKVKYSFRKPSQL